MEKESWLAFDGLASRLLRGLVFVVNFEENTVLFQVFEFLIGDWRDDLLNEVVQGLNVKQVIDQRLATGQFQEG